MVEFSPTFMEEFKNKQTNPCYGNFVSRIYKHLLCVVRGEEISNNSPTPVNLPLKFFATLSCIVENEIDKGCMVGLRISKPEKHLVTFWVQTANV